MAAHSLRFIASCDRSLCEYKTRTLREPMFYMNYKYQFMCAHHVPVLGQPFQCTESQALQTGLVLKMSPIISKARVHFYYIIRSRECFQVAYPC